MKRSKAIQLGQPILAKFVGAIAVGVAPRIMGIGPSIAIPKLLGKYNITINDCDIIEVILQRCPEAATREDEPKRWSHCSWPPTGRNWREADCDWSQRGEKAEEKDLVNQYVRWNRAGYGWTVRQ
jgi:hypothetical protein